jgi:agmatine deiminase
VVLEGPSRIRAGYDWEEFAAGYINFYLVNGALLMPEFGDRRADRNAKEILGGLFGDRDIIQLNIDNIAAGGGGIHCTTQQQPLVISSPDKG